MGTPTFDLVNGKSRKYYVLIRPGDKFMVKVMVSILPVLVLTGRLMSDLPFTGRVISVLALDWPETDHNFDHDPDTRSYLNVKFSALCIYEVKSDGSHLKKSI